MVDIHSHFIYAIDDGARNREESLELLEMDNIQGVTDVIATPHYSVGRPTGEDEIREKLSVLRRALKEKGSGLRLYSGNEVLFFESMGDKLREGEILTLAESRYVMIEFYPVEGYGRILQAVRLLRRYGYRPILAHAERYLALRKKSLEEIIAQGAYIQVNTDTLGKRGFSSVFDRELSFAKKALSRREVHFLGTDMHRRDTRPPLIEDALTFLSDFVSGTYMDRLLESDPEAILEDVEL